MNRGIMVTRDDPGQDELAFSARLLSNFLNYVHKRMYILCELNYGTVQLQLHFYTRVHARQHAVFRVCIA